MPDTTVSSGAVRGSAGSPHSQRGESAAVQLVRFGSVIVPQDQGKRALIRFKCRKASSLYDIRLWNRNLKPAFWALACGDRTVIDVDPRHGGEPLPGIDPHVDTPRGGWHYHCAPPPQGVVVRNGFAGDDWPGVEIKHSPGLLATIAGNGYEILQPLDNLTPWRDIPDSLRRSIVRTNRELSRPARVNLPNPQERVPVYTLVDRAIGRSSGNRNYTGFWLAAQLRDAGYSRHEAESAMRMYQEAVDDGRDRYEWIEARASLASAYSQAPRPAWGKAVA